jgi:septum formation protein
MTTLILASASPRRRALLEMAGFDFALMPANIDETTPDGLTPAEVVAFLSEKKALHVQGLLDVEAVVIGADTVVAIDGLILGKPHSEAEAFHMLSRLQGRAHTVYTGVSLVSTWGETRGFVESARVFFRPLTEVEIYAYIATGEPFDKAGAYGIQEKGALLVERIEGDFFSVMGFPLCRFHLAWREMQEARRET